MSDNKKPNIRFKGYSDDWEQRKFGEVLETVTDYVAAGSFADLAKNVEYKDYPDYAQLIRTKDLKNGFTSTQEVYVNKNAFDYLYRVNMDKECIILPNIGNCGEVYYVKPESLPYEHNVLGPNAIFVRSETCANNFLSILFQAKDFQTKLKLIVSPNGQTKFNKTELKGIDLILPRDVYEQEKIGQYFSNLDRLITLHQRKYNKLQTLKKAMLEKMFPKNGSNVPEIRFKGFTDAWEQRKVGELIKDGIIDAPLDGNHGEKHPTASEYVDSGIPFLMASDVHGGIADIKSCKFITRERAERLDKGFAKNGDVLLTHKATIGESAILQGLETEYAVLTPQVTYYRIQDEKKLSREYLYAFFNSVKFQNDLKTKAAQSTRPYIGISAQQNLDIVLPRKLTEQKKIGVYFSDLDHLITLHQRELEKLQNIKKAMLEKMFV